MALYIRPFRRTDIAFALTQTEREGWDSTVELFQICLAGDADGCFIGEMAGRPVGMITTIRHTQAAWIGDLIVIPEARSRGIGRRLMNHAMVRLADVGFETIRLEADPDGIPLYRSLGFEDEFESLRFRREPAAIQAETELMSESDSLSPLDDDAFARIQALDREAFGEDRSRILTLLRTHAEAAYVLKRDGSEVAGYAMVWPSRTGRRIGPAVARDARGMEAILSNVVARHGDQPLNIGLPEHSQAARTMLASMGFEQKRSCFRMRWGKSSDVGRPDWVLAIGNGAMG